MATKEAAGAVATERWAVAEGGVMAARERRRGAPAVKRTTAFCNYHEKISDFWRKKFRILFGFGNYGVIFAAICRREQWRAQESANVGRICPTWKSCESAMLGERRNEENNTISKLGKSNRLVLWKTQAGVLAKKPGKGTTVAKVRQAATRRCAKPRLSLASFRSGKIKQVLVSKYVTPKARNND
jgi:hypothetical protein